MKSVALLAALSLAACGASGLPIKPEAKSGVTISGSAGAGIATSGN